MPAVQDGVGSLHCLPYNVYFQNSRISQSVSMVGSIVEIKLLVVCHVAVELNIVGGGAVTNVVRTCSLAPLLLFEQ